MEPRETKEKNTEQPKKHWVRNISIALSALATSIATLVGIANGSLDLRAKLYPAPTASLATVSPPSRPNPAEVAKQYWLDVSAGNYETAWERLTVSFRNRVNPEGKAQYIEGFQPYCSIEAKDGETVEQTTTQAKALVRVVYYMKSLNCGPIPYQMEMTLVWDVYADKWMVDGNSARKTSP